MKNLCMENGYIDIPYIRSQGYPFTIITGARGTGKTFGALKDMIENKENFIYMRRTKTQIEVSMGDMCPLVPVCKYMGKEVETVKLSKEAMGIYIDGAETPQGYMMALSGISNVRGFSAENIDTIIFDEFIPESHERRIKNEGDAFFNAYETINRNRELQGRKPVQCLLLSNTNTIVNPIFQSLGIIGIAYEMAEKGVQEYKDKERGLYIINLRNSPISKKKAETALYRLLKDNRIIDMSLKNLYLDKPVLQTKSANLNEYKPVVTAGEITVYKHKSRKEYYISPHGRGTRPIYTTSENDILRFRTLYHNLLMEYIDRNIYCENPGCEIIFCQYFGIVR